MDEFFVDVNRTHTFQWLNHKMRYKPEDPYIRTAVIGIRPRADAEASDYIAYIECRIWNISRMKETTFWNYAYEYEKGMSENPFYRVCNYLKRKNKKAISGWAVYISEFTVFDDVINEYQELDFAELETEILSSIPTILQYSFFFKPSYVFICENELLPGSLEKAAYEELGKVGQASVYMKKC